MLPMLSVVVVQQMVIVVVDVPDVLVMRVPVLVVGVLVIAREDQELMMGLLVLGKSPGSEHTSREGYTVVVLDIIHISCIL